MHGIGTANIYEECLKIGIIQTIVDGQLAWETPYSTKMNASVELKVWQEIKKGFRNLKNGKDQPHIIVMPELTVPLGYKNDLINLSKDIGSVVIAGLDFIDNGVGVSNKAIIVVPHNWLDKQKSKNASCFYFGKTFFSDEEISLFNKLTPKRKPIPDPVTYIIDAGCFGKIGVAICSDFFDIERFVIYRGQIHHMIVISHNKDTNSYYFLAEAISRLVYCNVVICNSGIFGDSLVFSPFKDAFKRIIYRHEGQKLFTTQVINLPVLSLDNAQQKNDAEKVFKAVPPGYIKTK